MEELELTSARHPELLNRPQNLHITIRDIARPDHEVTPVRAE